MPENRTKAAGASVAAFLAGRPAGVRADCKVLMDIMERITGERARMWGPSMIGCGSYRYVYDSGHSGETFVIGFSPRATALTIYLTTTEIHADALQALGPHKTGRGCLYVKRLSDVDVKVLEQIMAKSRTWLLQHVAAQQSKLAAKRGTRRTVTRAG